MKNKEKQYDSMLKLEELKINLHKTELSQIIAMKEEYVSVLERERKKHLELDEKLRTTNDVPVSFLSKPINFNLIKETEERVLLFDKAIDEKNSFIFLLENKKKMLEQKINKEKKLWKKKLEKRESLDK